MRSQLCLLPIKALVFTACLVLVSPDKALFAQGTEYIPPPQQSAGGFFSRELGTALRFTFQTQGYGTEADVVSLGTMKVFNGEQGIIFIDGQATLSDDFGGGFNLGVGFRTMVNSDSPLFSMDPQRVLGMGFWTDGQSTAADNFFTQLGFSLESLGDSFDLRLNGQFPLDTSQTSDPSLNSTGMPFYFENEIYAATETIVTDTAYSVIDAEIAKRINDLEAWAYLGGYQLDAGSEDATGYRVGVRGYAVPDLALSLQVTDDDIYATNVVFGITWFVGRTNCNNEPVGNVWDRMREPVLRNSYIATTAESFTQPSGGALTATGTTNTIHVVHVDSTAAAGGDGTFENPLNSLETVESNSQAVDTDQEASIILVHGGSVLAETDNLTLQEGQQLLGEGVDNLTDMNQIDHFVGTNEVGVIELPETAPGAQDLLRPQIDASGVAGDFITLADGNVINNLDIDNADTAIVGNGINAPTIGNMTINDSSVTGISLTDITGTTAIENTVFINNAADTALLIDGGEETMSIAANIVNTSGRSLEIINRTGGAITYSGQIDDDGGTGILIDSNVDSTILLTNTDIEDADGNPIDNGIDINTGAGDAITITNNSVFPGQSSTISFSGTVGATATGTAQAVTIAGNDADTLISFIDLDATAEDGDTVSVTGGGRVTISSDTSIDPTRTIENTGTGDAFMNVGDLADEDNNANIIVNSEIENSVGGNSVNITDRSAGDIDFNGAITDTGEGLVISNNVFTAGNTGGTIDFNALVTSTTADTNAVTLDTNTDTTIRFLEGVDLETTGTGTGFSATGGGLIAVRNPSDANQENTIDTQDGIALELVDMTILGNDVFFDTINVTSGTSQGIILTNLDGDGSVLIGTSGTDVPDGGTLTTADTAIDISNALNVGIANMQINNNAGTAQGIEITEQEDTSVVTISNMEITTLDGNAVTIGDESNVAGTTNDFGTISLLDMVITTTGAGDGIYVDNHDDSVAVITVTNAEIDAQGTGRGFYATGGGTISVAGTNTIDSAGGVAFEVDNVENLLANDVTIDNTTAQGVRIHNQDTDTDVVTLTDFTVTTTTATGVEVDDNVDGTINLNTLVADSTTGMTVLLDNNGDANINIVDLEATSAGGDVFTATNGGVLEMTGTNNITASDPDTPGVIDGDGGRGIVIDGVEIGAGNATFAEVIVEDSGSTGIEVANTTGGQVLVNDGTLTTAGAAVLVTDADNVAISGVEINNGTSGGSGVVATNSVDDLLTLTNVEITTTGTGEGVNVSGGDFRATGTNTISTDEGAALTLADLSIQGTANFDTVDVSNGGAATTAISLTNIEGDTLTIGSGTNAGDGGTIATAGLGVFVSNVESLVVDNLTVNQSGAAAPAVTVTAQDTGSTATFNGLTVTTDGTATAVQIQNNLDGTIDFNNLETTTVDGVGVLVDNNADATVTLNNIEVETTGTASAGVAISRTGTTNITGTNTVDTASTTIGIDIDEAENVTMTDVTINAGGIGVDIEQVAATTDSNLIFTNVDVDSATTAGFNIVAGDIDDELDITMNNVVIGMTGTDDGIAMDTISKSRVDLTILNSTITAEDGSAFVATLDDADGNIRFLFQGDDAGSNTFTNNSTTAATFDVTVDDGTGLSAQIGILDTLSDNTDPVSDPTRFDANIFTNSAAGGTAFVIDLDSGSVDLDLRGNRALGTTTYVFDAAVGTDFRVVDQTDTLNGTNNTGGAITDVNGNTVDRAPPVQVPD